MNTEQNNQPIAQMSDEEVMPPDHPFMQELALMSSLIDQIGRDNTTVTRGAVKIRLGNQIKRLFDKAAQQQQAEYLDRETLKNWFVQEIENLKKAHAAEIAALSESPSAPQPSAFSEELMKEMAEVIADTRTWARVNEYTELYNHTQSLLTRYQHYTQQKQQ